MRKMQFESVPRKAALLLGFAAILMAATVDLSTSDDNDDSPNDSPVTLVALPSSFTGSRRSKVTPSCATWDTAVVAPRTTHFSPRRRSASDSLFYDFSSSLEFLSSLRC